MEKKYASNTESVTIDLGEIVLLLFNKLWLILLTGVTVGLIFATISQFLITPTYESTTKIYVLNKADSSYLTTSDMSVSSSLIQDYTEIVKSRTVTESVISQLDLDLTYEEFLGKIQVRAESADTRILAITVVDEDPYVASIIANTVREVASNHISDVMDTVSIEVVDQANIPDKKAGPNIVLNGILGAGLGIALSLIIILIVSVLNDTIQTQEDVEKYLGLSVLGTIPMTGKEKKSKIRRKKARRRRK